MKQQTADPSKTPRLEAFAVHFTPLWAPEGIGYRKRQGCFRTVKAAFFFVSDLENIAELRAFSFSVRARLWCQS
jgi:hypothetical protein